MFKFGKSSKHRKFDFFVHVCLFRLITLSLQRQSTMTLADRDASWKDDIFLLINSTLEGHVLL